MRTVSSREPGSRVNEAAAGVSFRIVADIVSRNGSVGRARQRSKRAQRNGGEEALEALAPVDVEHDELVPARGQEREEPRTTSAAETVASTSDWNTVTVGIRVEGAPPCRVDDALELDAVRR